MLSELGIQTLQGSFASSSYKDKDPSMKNPGNKVNHMDANGTNHKTIEVSLEKVQDLISMLELFKMKVHTLRIKNMELRRLQSL